MPENSSLFSGFPTDFDRRTLLLDQSGKRHECGNCATFPISVKKSARELAEVRGMQAALTCAHAGTRRDPCEQSDRLGGVLLCEEEVYYKKT
jgi:hypothetical protein